DTIAAQARGPMATLLGGGGAARCLANLKRVADAGLPLGLGTDAGNPFTPHGPSTLYELQLYVEAGLTPGQALAAATSGNAAILGLADAGTLAPGRIADVLVVRGDPTARITDMAEIADVIKGGVRVDRAAHARRNLQLAAPAVARVVGRDLPSRVFDGTSADAAEAGAGATPVSSPAPASAQAGAWPGAWEVYSDTLAPGGKSSCALRWVQDAEGERLVLEGALAEGSAYGAFGGAALLWAPARKLLADASALTGLRLRLRGTPRDGNLTVQCAAVKDWNVFATPLRPTEEWSVVEVPFTALHQIGFGRSVPWTGADITGLNVEARNGAAAPTYGPFRIEVDWIEFY
ncbi:MAG TPA: CIA30 family protein, partial [Planctomycetota bacterium]|nr:CIA30 family protein [Planctomycetota bacterium]